MHGKASHYVVCGTVATAVCKWVMLTVQVRKLVLKLNSFSNNFQAETASVQMCTPLCLCIWTHKFTICLSACNETVQYASLVINSLEKQKMFMTIPRLYLKKLLPLIHPSNHEVTFMLLLMVDHAFLCLHA